MKKVSWVLLCGMLSVIALVLACAPKAQPTPTATKAAPQQSPAATQAATQAPASASGWDKVLAAAKTEGKVVVYTTYGQAPWQEAVTKLMKDKYGIQVQFLQSGGAANFEKIKTEDRAGQVVGDIYEGGFIPETKPYAQRFDPPEVAIAPKDVWAVSPGFRDPAMGVITTQAPKAIGPNVINTQRVKPQDEPKSYLDLLDPKWKGQMSFHDPTIPGEGSGIYLWLSQLYPDYWQKMAKQEIKIVRDYAEGPRRVATGEDAIGIAVNISSLQRYLEQGAPVKFMIPKEGVYTSPSVMFITRSAPHVNAAKVFINFLLTKEGQETSHLMGLLPIRKDVKVKEALPELQRIVDATPRTLLTNEARDIMSKQLANRDAANVFGLGK